jgi:5-methylcytosine-specific restriction endonuclease McrA
MVTPGRSGGDWQRARKATLAHAQAIHLPCWLCRRPISWELTKLAPRHRLAATVHHIHGLAQGGHPTDLDNLTVAHRGCNTRESNRVRALLKMRQRCLNTLKGAD